MPLHVICSLSPPQIKNPCHDYGLDSVEDNKVKIWASFFNEDDFLVVSWNGVIFFQELGIERVSFVFLI